MAREHRLITWCDICLNVDDRYIEGIEFTFSVGRKEKVLTVCPEHEEAVVAPFLTVFNEYAIDNPDAKPRRGRPPGSSPAAAVPPALGGERVPCPICAELGAPQKSGGMKNIDTLVVHMNRSHGLARAEARNIATGLSEYELVDGGPMATVRRAA